jgi:hypothetical protein
MFDARKTQLKLSLLFALVAPLWLGNRGCVESDDGSPDAGGQSTRDSGPSRDASPGDGDGGDPPSGACEAEDCEGQPIPEIGCEQGTPTVVCERRGDGSCGVRVLCSSGKCGGFAGETCSAEEFCNMEQEVGGDGCTEIADGQGVCEPLPKICPDIYAPVCSCDLRTYSNACEAHAQGKSVKHSGLCTGDECISAGGRPEYSDGASVPRCKDGEVSYELAGIEPAICCLPAGS